MKSVSIFKKPVVLLGLLGIFFFLSLVIVLALFMGQDAGNFVVQVEDGTVKKTVKITESLENPEFRTRLEGSGYLNLTDTTYTMFDDKIESFIAKGGDFIDEGACVYAYTFYIVNDNEEALDIKATLSYSNVTRNLDKAIRVMTVSTNTDKKVYQAKDDVEKDYGAAYPSIELFSSETECYNEMILGIEPGESVKYSVLFWLEGNDPDCVDTILGGTVKFSLKLSIL